MDLSSTVGAVSAVGPSGAGQQPAAHTPAASPELVSKFEALMARAGPPQGGHGGGTVPPAAVAHVDHHLQKYEEVLDNVMKVNDGQMSLVDIQAMAMRNITQVGVMSMTHNAYTQVLSSAKGSVSSLIKNQ